MVEGLKGRERGEWSARGRMNMFQMSSYSLHLLFSIQEAKHHVLSTGNEPDGEKMYVHLSEDLGNVFGVCWGIYEISYCMPCRPSSFLFFVVVDGGVGWSF